MARIGHADRLPSGLPIGALRFIQLSIKLLRAERHEKRNYLFDDLDLSVWSRDWVRNWVPRARRDTTSVQIARNVKLNGLLVATSTEFYIIL